MVGYQRLLSVFTSDEIRRMSWIQRMLLGLSVPGIADHVSRLGYHSDAHTLGWRDLATASGLNVLF